MKRKILLPLLCVAAAALLCGLLLFKKNAEKDDAAKPLAVIFDTDMGNDVDDVIALEMLANYMRAGVLDLKCVSVGKCNPYAVEFTDGYLKYHGYAEIPLGFAYNGVTPEGTSFLIPTLEAEAGGKKILTPAENVAATVPEGYVQLRRTLSEAEDGSVIAIAVGPLTNIARLLESEPDEISPLSGVGLVREKVKSLYVMGGDFSGSTNPEYNILMDIDAAKCVFEKCPVETVACGFEIGLALPYPASSIMEDFGDPAQYPLCIAYFNWGTMPYDRPSWDPATVLAAIEPDAGYFSYSPAGKISVDDEGRTSFEESPEGLHRYLLLDENDRGRVLDALVSRTAGK